MIRPKLLAIAAKSALVFASVASLAGTPIEAQRVINRLQLSPQFFTEGRNYFDREVQFLLKRARISSDRLPISEEWITEAKPWSLDGQIVVRLERSDFQF